MCQDQQAFPRRKGQYLFVFPLFKPNFPGANNLNGGFTTQNAFEDRFSEIVVCQKAGATHDWLADVDFFS